jgi:adenine-specific DNA-methyltransferase
MFAPSLFPPPPLQNLSNGGVVYTKEWAARFVLDLAGYTESANLVDSLAVEPAAGEGVFLIEMAKRLIASCRRQNRPLSDCKNAIAAFELIESSAASARAKLFDTLRTLDVPSQTAELLSSQWVSGVDYLLDYVSAGYADFVIGNPPYVRLEDLPVEASRTYRQLYPTMTGRADLYIAFFEAALRQLEPVGAFQERALSQRGRDEESDFSFDLGRPK